MRSEQYRRLWWEAALSALSGFITRGSAGTGTEATASAIADAMVVQYERKFTDDPPDSKAYEGWAHVEIKGHREHYGLVREVRAYGTRMLEIQVLDRSGKKFDEVRIYESGAIFGVLQLDENTCRQLADHSGGGEDFFGDEPDEPDEPHEEDEENKRGEVRP